MPFARPSCRTLGVVKNQLWNSEPPSRLRVLGFKMPYFSARASSKLASVTWKATALRIALKECKSSARAEARARTNVGQSVRPQLSRARMPITARKASVALPRGLQLKSGMQRLISAIATSNPSIEGMPKRLRLSVTPHVKR